MATAIMSTTTGIVYVRSISGTITLGYIDSTVLDTSASAVTSTVPIAFPQGSAGAPALYGTGDTTSGLAGSGTGFGRLFYTYSSVPKVRFNGAGAGLDIASDWTLAFASGTNVEVNAIDTVLSRGAANRLDLASADSLNLVGGGGSLQMAAKVVISSTAPTIASGFGTTPSIAASNGTAAFTVNVGTGGTADTGVITLPTATTGWALSCINLSNSATAVTAQTASTTTSATIANYSRTTGLLTAWTASDIISITAVAY